MSVNKVILIGRLGKDPELRKTTNGTPVANISLATTERGPNDKEYAEWHSVILWKRQAEIVCQYTKKGHMLYVEGRLQTRKWQDKQGNEHRHTEIVAHNIQLLNKTNSLRGDVNGQGNQGDLPF